MRRKSFGIGGSASSKFHFDILALPVVDLEVGESSKTAHLGDNHGGEGLDVVVVVAHDGVVIAPGVLYVAFDVGQGALQLPEVFVGLELGVVFRQGEDAADAGAEGLFGLGLPSVVGLGDGLGLVAQADDLLQGFLLVRSIALDGVDEIGDEVVAALELHGNAAPGFLGLVAEPDALVVSHDCPDGYDNDDSEEDIHSFRFW